MGLDLHVSGIAGDSVDRGGVDDASASGRFGGHEGVIGPDYVGLEQAVPGGVGAGVAGQMHDGVDASAEVFQAVQVAQIGHDHLSERRDRLLLRRILDHQAQVVPVQGMGGEVGADAAGGPRDEHAPRAVLGTGQCAVRSE